MSTTYLAGIVTILTMVLPHFGIFVQDPNTLTSTLQDVVGLVSVVWIFYGRYRAGGITAIGLRKA